MPFDMSSDREVDLEPSALSARKNMVRMFYKEMWDKADTSLIPLIFHEGFTFRGSLGPELVGFDQFADYVRWLTETLDDYTSDILSLIEDGDRVSAKLRFHGYHRKALFGCPPSGKRIWWNGAPIFTFEGDKVRDLWVLGDVHGLIARMQAEEAKPREFSAGGAAVA